MYKTMIDNDENIYKNEINEFVLAQGISIPVKRFAELIMKDLKDNISITLSKLRVKYIVNGKMINEITAKELYENRLHYFRTCRWGALRKTNRRNPLIK